MRKLSTQWEKRNTLLKKSKVRFAVLSALMKIFAKPKQLDTKYVQEIAQTIAQQLGGQRFKMMVGAKDFLSLTVTNSYGDRNPALRFKIMRNAKSVNLVVVALNGKDLYDMYFYRTRGAKEPLLVAEANDIYADEMRRTFEKHTGLYTSL